MSNSNSIIFIFNYVGNFIYHIRISRSFFIWIWRVYKVLWNPIIPVGRRG